MTMFALRLLSFIGAVAGIVQGAETVLEAREVLKRDGGCPNAPPGGWALPVYFIGDSSDDPQCATQFGKDYTPISGIEVWRSGDGDHIAGETSPEIWPTNIRLTRGQTGIQFTL